MSERACSRHDARWLELALVGDLEIARVHELESCADCGPRLAELRACERMLRADARERDADARAAGAASPDEQRAARELVARTLGGRALGAAAAANTDSTSNTPTSAAPMNTGRGADGAHAARSARVPATRLRLVALLAAAAVVLFGAWLALRTPRSEPPVRPDDALLGDGRLELAEPMGDVAQFGAFRWSYRSLEPVTYTLAVYAAAPASSDDDAERLLYRSGLSERVLEVDAATVATWPKAIRWDVSVVDAQGRTLTSRHAAATRAN